MLSPRSILLKILWCGFLLQQETFLLNLHKEIYMAIGLLFVNSSIISRGMWLNLWNARLHNWHKHFLWKLCSNTLPSKRRLNNILNFDYFCCDICLHSYEDYHHLFLTCSLIISLLLNSRWQIKLEAFNDWTLPTSLLFLPPSSIAACLIPFFIPLSVHCTSLHFSSMFTENYVISHRCLYWTNWASSTHAGCSRH